MAPYEASISGVSLKRWYMTCSADPAFGAAGSGGGGGAGAVEEVDASDNAAIACFAGLGVATTTYAHPVAMTVEEQKVCCCARNSPPDGC